MSLLLVRISGRLTQNETLCEPPILSCFYFLLFKKSIYYFHAHMCIYPLYSYFFIYLTHESNSLISFLWFNLVKHIKLRILLDFLVCNLIIN
jgi:hypothetical protein